MDFFNDIFHNLALLEFYFLNIFYILLYIEFILSLFFQHSNILTRASHHWCLASNIVLVRHGTTCGYHIIAWARVGWVGVGVGGICITSETPFCPQNPEGQWIVGSYGCYKQYKIKFEISVTCFKFAIFLYDSLCTVCYFLFISFDLCPPLNLRFAGDFAKSGRPFSVIASSLRNAIPSHQLAMKLDVCSIVVRYCPCWWHSNVNLQSIYRNIGVIRLEYQDFDI